MSTLTTDELDLTAHNDRIYQLTMQAASAWNAGLSVRPLLDELEQETAKCKAYGCWKESPCLGS